MFSSNTFTSVKITRSLDNLFIFMEREKRLKDTPWVSFSVLPLRVRKYDKIILGYILIDLQAWERTKPKLEVFPKKL
jgi:hypothetical protein